MGTIPMLHSIQTRLEKDGAVTLDTTYQPDEKKGGSLKTQREFQLW